ncbi:TPT domain-containing protein [Mycena indigotica]|uniref:TPT domain-containing protein n=1 Tax=Mycena indigotica TaxID=2126181 RepID=A0A8H6S5Z7_9AGAR|nr:TPT domain-containing protein [Mycena indigotica]KAF7293032.1 TPT domain-containing protein [Mycena indigotica]
MPNQLEAFSPKVVAVVCFYIVAALVMVLVNKAVLNQTPDLPFTFLCIQFCIAVLLLRALVLISDSPLHRIIRFRLELPVLDRATATKLIPLLCVGFIGLVFNTLCLAKVDATFFQITRGLLLPFTILVSSLVTRSFPAKTVIAATVVVTIGFIVGSAESFSSYAIDPEALRAVFYGLISCLVLAIYTVMSKVATTTMKHSVFVISYWGNLGMATMTLPLIICNGEIAVFQQRIANPEQEWTTFVVGCGVTGIFGFLLSLANILSIKVTNPTSHMFSAAAKTVIQTLIGVLFFGDLLDVSRATGILLITAGTIFYTWAQIRPHPQQPSYEAVPTLDDVEKQTGETDDEEDDDIEKDLTEMKIR